MPAPKPPTPAKAAKPPHVQKTAPDTKQELRDAAAHLARTAHNAIERRFYAAIAADQDKQIAAATPATPAPATPASSAASTPK